MKDLPCSSSIPVVQVYPRIVPLRMASPSLTNVCSSTDPIHQPPITWLSQIRAAPRRQREAQMALLRREGIYLEEEYREEIRHYMYEMEVRLTSTAFNKV